MLASHKAGTIFLDESDFKKEIKLKVRNSK